MARRYYSSTAQRTTLASSVNDSSTTLSVTAVSGWPSSFPYTLIIDQDTINEEIVEVTARSGTTLTVTRGVDGTTGVAHDAGAAVNHGVSARDFDEPNAFINGTDFVSTDGGSTVEASGAAVTPLVLKGASGQTANLLTVEDSAGTDLVVVDEAGNVGIGTTSPATQLEIASDATTAAATIRLTDTDTSVEADRAFGAVEFYTNDASSDGTGVKAFIKAYTRDLTPDAYLSFGTNASAVDGANAVERMRIIHNGAVLIGTSSEGSAGAGDLVVNGGVFLGGSAAANELDDYEEGTFTPEVADATTGGNVASPSTAIGRYTKIGDTAFVQIRLDNINTTGLTAGNNVYIRGFPFNFAGSYSQGLIISFNAINWASDSAPVPVAVANSNYVRLFSQDSTGSNGTLQLVSSFGSPSTDITISGTYFTA